MLQQCLSLGQGSYLCVDVTVQSGLLINPGMRISVPQAMLGHVKLMALVLLGAGLDQCGRAAELSQRLKLPVWALAVHRPKFRLLPLEAEQRGLCGVKVPQVQRWLGSQQSLAMGPWMLSLHGTAGQLRLTINDLVTFLC